MLETNKDLIHIIDRLIQDDGYRSYSDLSPSDKESVTAFCLTKVVDTADMDYFFSDETNTIASHLIKYITTSETCRALDLAESLKKAAIQYFDDILIELFQDRLDFLQVIENEENGMIAHIDDVNGEVLWTR